MDSTSTAFGERRISGPAISICCPGWACASTSLSITSRSHAPVFPWRVSRVCTRAKAISRPSSRVRYSSTSAAPPAVRLAVERIIAMMLRVRCCSSPRSTPWCSSASQASVTSSAMPPIRSIRPCSPWRGKSMLRIQRKLPSALRRMRNSWVTVSPRRAFSRLPSALCRSSGTIRDAHFSMPPSRSSGGTA